MLTKLEQDYYMRALDVDIKGDWMPSAILVRMQEIAEDNATAVGFGRAQLVESRGLAWILTRLHVQMDRYPKIAQTIRVSTWPTPPTKLTFLRQFAFHDMDGNCLGRASSQWVLFDIKERVMRRTKEIGENYPVDPTLEIVLEDPKKIYMPDDMAEAQTRMVRYSDVDMNKHMNNVKYADWICELFDTETLKTRSIKNLKINFVAEAFLDQDVKLYMGTKTDDAGHYICGETEGKKVFDGYIEWGRGD